MQGFVKTDILFILAVLLKYLLDGLRLEILKIVRFVKDQLCFCGPFQLP
jgi:hypothetical protein